LADDHDLSRFVEAQDVGDTYDAAVAQLRAGHKTGHWMWFIFPQLAGLGRSSMSAQFAIGSLDEARAYLRHAVLGPRLMECATIVAGTRGRTAEQIFGGIDALKLRSSVTLFLRTAPDVDVFRQILDRYYDGEGDARTVELLEQ
jgi:uncharacterized protein (DUF1810 family)